MPSGSLQLCASNYANGTRMREQLDGRPGKNSESTQSSRITLNSAEHCERLVSHRMGAINWASDRSDAIKKKPTGSHFEFQKFETICRSEISTMLIGAHTGNYKVNRKLEMRRSHGRSERGPLQQSSRYSIVT